MTANYYFVLVSDLRDYVRVNQMATNYDDHQNNMMLWLLWWWSFNTFSKWPLFDTILFYKLGTKNKKIDKNCCLLTPLLLLAWCWLGEHKTCVEQNSRTQTELPVLVMCFILTQYKNMENCNWYSFTALKCTSRKKFVKGWKVYLAFTC